MCWSLAMSISSFLNSTNPCDELIESLFTAISCPSGNFPWITVLIRESFKLVNMQTHNGNYSGPSLTLYTGPKPPCPSLFSIEKLFVAATTNAKLNTFKSWHLFFPSLLISFASPNLFEVNSSNALSSSLLSSSPVAQNVHS